MNLLWIYVHWSSACLKKSAAASLIIVGDEMLAKQMKLAVMTPIRTRLTVNFPMEPLSEQETEQFIAYRLAHAKASKDLFEPELNAMVARVRKDRNRQRAKAKSRVIWHRPDLVWALDGCEYPAGLAEGKMHVQNLQDLRPAGGSGTWLLT